MICEMCGSEGKLFKTSIENSELNVCKKCSKYGKVIATVKTEATEKKQRKKYKKARIPEEEIIQIIVSDYSERIKRKRNELGLKQKEFAKKINEKESLIHKIETCQFEPNITLARKIEKFLKINLIEQHEEKHKKTEKTKADMFTIGDFIKTKK